MKKADRDLFEAIVMNNQQKVSYAIKDNGADIKFIDSAGNSPAHYAAAYGHKEILHILYSLSDMSIFEPTNKYGNTPFLLAVESGSDETLHKIICEIGYVISDEEKFKLSNFSERMKSYVQYLIIKHSAKSQYSYKNTLTMPCKI